MERKLQISLVTENRSLGEKLSEIFRSTGQMTDVSWFFYEDALLEEIDESASDVFIIDRINNTSGWSGIYGEICRNKPDAVIIFIIGDANLEDAAEMMEAGVYDVLFHSDQFRIKLLLTRILTDIEDRLEKRKLLRENYFNNHIVNHSRSMLSIINRDYIYEKVNTKFCTAQNIDVHQIIGKSLSEVWGNETFREKIKQNIDMCFKGNTVRYEANFVTPLFGKRHYEVVFHPLPSDSGEISHLLAETFDISDLRQSQQAMREMEEEFKKLETNLPIGFLRCEPDGTIIHTNKAFMNIMEVEHEDSLSGLVISEFYTEKGLFEIHLNQLGSEKIKTFGRVPLYTFKGTEIVCRISGFIVSSDVENQSFIDFAFEDCSRELMLENRLLQAQKLETIGALAGGLSHDFNNILGTIIGYAELILDENEGNKPLDEKISKIISAVTKAKNLTNQILTFSRQVEQERIAVSVSEVLNETIGFLETGKPRNIIIEKSLSENGNMVLADPTQLFRVFLNLMTNAIQSMEEKGGILSVSLGIVEGISLRRQLSRDILADEYIVITFEDTGRGMDPSIVSRIFEPYFTTREVGKGTGLGLSVVHGIVSEMDGEILVTSKKNAGSVFTVYLPVAKENAEPEIISERNKKILFITGNKYESKIISIALEKKRGYQIKYASTVPELSEIVSDPFQQPDSVLYMDDSEEIRPDFVADFFSELYNKIPVILITDDEHSESKEKLLNSGVAKQVLNKPVSLREIDNAIQVSLV